MGGSYIDSAVRLLFTALSLTAFCFFAFHQATDFRSQNGLYECVTVAESSNPLAPDDPMAASNLAFNVSRYWLWVYYAHIGAAGYTIV